MGIVLSKFRKKKTSEEVLESIEERISTIEESQKESQLQQRKIRQISYASVTFLVFAAFFYVYFFSKNLRRLEAFLFIIPTIIIAELVRRIISWYYQRKVVKTQKKLIDLRAQKKKILDEVMNNETFNKAKEILEKYAPDQLPKGPGIIPITRSTPSNTSVAKTPAFSNSVKKSLFTPNSSVIPSPAINNSQSLVKSYPSRMLPRPILPADKTVLEKLVEMIVGDGPGQRFALICKACNSHNGMALKEEFEYLAYKCAYCSHFNPARKEKLVAPKLPDYSSALSEVSPFNSSTYATKAALSTVSEARMLSPTDKISERNDDTSVSELDRKINCELNGKAKGELENKTCSGSVGEIDSEADGGVKVKVDSKISNESKDEIEREVNDHKDGEDASMAMEIDEVEGEKDMAEYVSDEDSLSESERKNSLKD